MDIDCPECKRNNELDCDDVPDRACDDADFECEYCEHVFSIGWYATAEIRNPYKD